MTTDLVKTYNFDGGQHLASQNQKICIRRERGFCQICWATTAEGDFETSGGNTGAAGVAWHKAYAHQSKWSKVSLLNAETRDIYQKLGFEMLISER